ncbi:MAG: capsular polysaccharide biosynthesis protein [Halopseudomonas sp.]
MPHQLHTQAHYFSKGIGRIQILPSILSEFSTIKKTEFYQNRCCTAVLGWGLKPTADKARKVATKKRIPYISLEDGFLRSLGLGVAGFQPHSLIIDSIGIYYDATRSSGLEKLILETDLDETELARTKRAIALISQHRLSKYNHAPDRPVFPDDNQRRVLVVDQTFGDASVTYGGATTETFLGMLDAAIADNPGAEVVVKIHPDVIAAKKQGYLFEQAKKRHCRVLAEDSNPWALFDQVDKVYVVTSQLGFEALMAGLEVHCFGLPFYAGWGLTHDSQSCPRRNQPRSLEQVFAAAYLKYCRYANPYTLQRCELEDTIALIADQKRQQQRLQGRWIGFGLSRWKRQFVADFLGQNAQVRFQPTAEASLNLRQADENLLGWSSRIEPTLATRYETEHLPLWHMEDGFVRSVGLGVDLTRPMSLVIDSQGIYYDASQPSDLEQLLSTHPFDANLLERASKVRQRLIELNLSKYNVGTTEQLDLPQEKKIILVPGQVETDASIAKGSPVIKTNLALLQAVRSDNPDAYIIYKPHPDVESGGRIGELPQDQTALYDLLLTEISMPALLDQVDEVHTMSSLTGFEALLRQLKVVTYGMPFYAGWGLTTDKLTCDRRIRKLTLEQLVAATLILYPVYADPTTRQVCNIETTIDLIAQHRAQARGTPIKTKLYRLYRKVFEGRI